jgi:hypothetical protein
MNRNTLDQQGRLSAAIETLLDSMFQRIGQWAFGDGAWWLSSVFFHATIFCVLMLLGNRSGSVITNDAPAFTSTQQAEPASVVVRLAAPVEEEAETPEDPKELSTDTLTLKPFFQISQTEQIAQTEQYNDDNPIFSERGGGGREMDSDQPMLGGLGGFDVKASGTGSVVRGPGGVGAGVGTGTDPGSGGNGMGFGGRGTGWRKAMLGRQGGTKQSERAVAAALDWLSRHQMHDGKWSLANYTVRCEDHSCTGPGNADTDMGATALALLPFLGAGQTHKSTGPYQKNISNGLNWMLTNQQPNGDLRAGQTMYAHGLTSIVLCEACGMTGDPKVREAAQRAINFIEAAQNPDTGGWRYQPGAKDSDTSVLGWQVMALKSGQMAGLAVDPENMENAKDWLGIVATGIHREQYLYQPFQLPSLAMTAVGLLCRQYLGAKRNEPMMTSGSAFLLANLPDAKEHDVYYWYYATQVMHNFSGPDWDVWNRKMRRILIETQDKENCAAGSWNPDKPAPDKYGSQGGRLMMTSLCALTLEVYYRYLPLYKLEMEEEPAKTADANKSVGKQDIKIEKVENVDK